MFFQASKQSKTAHRDLCSTSLSLSLALPTHPRPFANVQSAATSMCHEITSIIVSRVQWLVFRPHRYVINFGYGAGSDMASAGFMIIALLLELAFE